MNVLDTLKRQGIAKLLLRLLMISYIIGGLVLWSTQNVGGLMAGSLLMGGAAFVYFGLAILQQLTKLRELLTYLLLNRPAPQETLSVPETTPSERPNPTANVYTGGAGRRA